MAGLSTQESDPVDLRTTQADSTPHVGDSVRPDLRLPEPSTQRVGYSMPETLVPEIDKSATS